MASWTPYLLGVLLVVGLSTPGQARTRGIVGQKAPALWAQSWRNLPKGTDSFDVRTQRGKVLVLFFFQSWCPGCHRRDPKMIKIKNTLLL